MTILTPPLIECEKMHVTSPVQNLAAAIEQDAQVRCSMFRYVRVGWSGEVGVREIGESSQRCCFVP